MAPHQEETAEVVLASGENVPACLPGMVLAYPTGRRPKADPGHEGDIISVSWLGTAGGGGSGSRSR